MPFGEAIRIAVDSLWANKLRSFLTVLGILIGVSSVVAVVAIINGLDGYVADRVLELGSKSFSVQKMPDVITSHSQWQEMQKRKDLNLHDLEAVARGCEACSEVGASVGISRTAKRGRLKQSGVRISGITENIPRIGSVRDLESGRHLIQDDIDQSRLVAVIGTDVRDTLFATLEPIGKEILVDGYPIKVVGVAEKKGSVFGESQDEFLWIPITTFRKLFGIRRSITIQAEARSQELFETAQDQAHIIMRARRHLDYARPDDFSIETGESILQLWQSFTRGIYVVTVVVTSMSLVIGGIVVMNIMLVSVTERIREIGVRKALGARRRDIRAQFMVESVILSAFGGALGIIGATLAAWALGAVLGGIMSAEFSAQPKLWAILAAVAMSTGVGLIAGVYPASRAAALDPVVALRNE